MTEKENSLSIIWGFLVAQLVKNPPAMQETWVTSLGWEEPPEKEMATHSSILCLGIPMDRGPWRAAVHGVAKSGTRMSTQEKKKWHNLQK